MKNSYTIYITKKWENYFSNQICKYLLDNKYEACIKNKTNFDIDIRNKISNWYGILRKYIIIQNNKTKQFFAIDHADQFDHIVKEIVAHPLCICILKCQYRKGSYGECENKISPFSYGVKEEEFFSLRKKYINSPKNKTKMYFKGNEIGRSVILKTLFNIQLINDDYGYREKGVRAFQISQKYYLKKMAKRKMALSLPGIGNFCHREIEAFGIKVPVLMPILKNQYYNNLIPDFHYISIDNTKLGNLKTDYDIRGYNQSDIDAFCKMIENRYKEVYRDNKYLKYISNNASIWFKNNILYPSIPNLIQKILKDKFNYEL